MNKIIYEMLDNALHQFKGMEFLYYWNIRVDMTISLILMEDEYETY